MPDVTPKTPTPTRRAVLRGAGAMLALPFLESLAAKVARAEGLAAAAASAAAKPPLRMGIFTVTGGTVLESWKMKSAGPLAGPLPSILRPLDFARQDLLLLTGLSHSGKSEGLNGHEACAFAHLTGAPVTRKEAGKPCAGISVDQAAAAVAGRGTFLPSLEVGLSNHETQYSFRSASAQVPYESDPRLVFERMFRGRTPIVPNWQRRAAADQARKVRDSAAAGKSYDATVVDLILSDAKDLRGSLGSADQQKLDEYLLSVQSIEKRIATLESRLAEEALDAKNPGPSTLVMPALPDKKLNFGKYRDQLMRDPAVHAEYVRIVADLMVLAFQTDTTRVMTLAVGADDAMFPGVVTVGYERHCHTLEHQGNAARVDDADPIAREACRQIHAWYTTLFAEMVRKMKAVDEGGSTLLDNSMLLYTSYMADGGHGREDYPALLVGQAGGRLKTGRQVDYKPKTPASNLYVEMLDRMGVSADGFGDSRSSKYQQYDGRLPGLA